MSWQDMFDQAEEFQGQTFDDIQNGTYFGLVDEAKLNETKGRVEITWVIQDKESPYKNRKVFSNYQLTEKGIPFLKHDLRTMGWPDVTAKNLPEAVQHLRAQLARIYVKQRPHEGKMFYNVYVNELVTDEDYEQATGAPKLDANEELPF